MFKKVIPLPIHNENHDVELGEKNLVKTALLENQPEVKSSPSIDMIVGNILRSLSYLWLLKYKSNITDADIYNVIKGLVEVLHNTESWNNGYNNHVPSKESRSTLYSIFHMFIEKSTNTVDTDNIANVADDSTAKKTIDIFDWYFFNIILILLNNSEEFRQIVREISYEDKIFEHHVIKRIDHNNRLSNKNYIVNLIDTNGTITETKNLHELCVSLLSTILATVPEDGFKRDKLKVIKDQTLRDKLVSIQVDNNSIVPHMHDVDTICTKFNTSKTHGLTDEQVKMNLEKYGNNIMPKPTLTPLWRIIFHKFSEPMILFLIGFITFEIIIMNTASENVISDLIGIILTIILVIGTVIVGTKQDYDAERSGSKHDKPTPTVTVIRNGTSTVINTDSLVVGDIVLIKDEGEGIPADGRVFEPQNFETIEAMLTGESIGVKKSDVILPRATLLGNRKNMCFSGTASASSGMTKLVITATGVNTEAGKLIEIIERTKKENQNKKTPLMNSIAILSYALIFLAIVFCGCILFVGIGVGYHTIEILETSLSLAASAVPEGLPAILIITVTIVATVMKKAKCEIRNNSAVQTIGSLSIVCSDKTGTLTCGKMSARFEDSIFKPENRDEFIKTSLLCNAVDVAKLYVSCVNDTYSCVHDKDGDTTEIAIIRMIQQKFPDLCNDIIKSNERIFTCPFDSNRKCMSIIINDTNNNCIKILTKGAPESVMRICNLTTEDKEFFTNKNTEMTQKGIRVLGIAIKTSDMSVSELKNLDSEQLTEYAESNMTFIGLAGIMDPPKDGVKETVEELARAHIPVVMITGDHPNTGIAIATELSIFDPNTNIAMTGSDFAAWAESYKDNPNDKSIIGTFNRVKVFARVTPEEKRSIVKHYQNQKKVVAMLGDGPNDAPAIVEADVGYAMNSGTDLAKDNADVVILDNRLNSLTESVKYGRSVFENVQKFIIYLISCNFAEVFTMLFFVCFGGELPFTTNMLLWANIFADIPPSIAISYEAPHKNIMENHPIPRTKKIIPNMLFMFIFVQSILMTVYTCLSFSVISHSLNYDHDRARTLAYAVLSAVQLTHTYWCRYPFEYINSIKSFVDTMSTSKHVNVGVSLSFVLLVVSIYIPGFNRAIGIIELEWLDWIIVLCACIVHGIIMQFVKYVMKRVL